MENSRDSGATFDPPLSSTPIENKDSGYIHEICRKYLSIDDNSENTSKQGKSYRKTEVIEDCFYSLFSVSSNIFDQSVKPIIPQYTGYCRVHEIFMTNESLCDGCRRMVMEENEESDTDLIPNFASATSFTSLQEG